MTPKRTKCLVVSVATSDALDQLAAATGRSLSSIADEILGGGARHMILDTLPPDRGLTPFRSGLGSVEGVLVARRRAGDSQLKRRYSFELLGENTPGGDLLALVYVLDADRWRVPSETECRDLAGVVDGGDDLVLTTAAGIRWWITEFIDTVDRRVTPASPRLIARLQRRRATSKPQSPAGTP